ncbi:methionyl-tRNA formyltransferase [Candidatus Uhrbacteria bacterium]|nr:methionyl-tRNA formyltransferase [Candidatus Uhrbacteria bacterium]
MGTPEYAVPFFEGLVQNGFAPITVVSQPDRPVGRKQIIESTPVKKAAQELGVPVIQPENANDATFLNKLRELNPDVFVVVAFGQILSAALLEIPRLGTINVHPSLLPKYRGAAPLQEAILSGDSETGVTIMLMDEKMDHGPILLQEKIALAPDETLSTLQDKTIAVGVPLLLKAIELLEAGTAQKTSQDDSKATYTRLLTRDSGKLDFSKSAQELERHVRALNPWPGTWMEWKGKRLKIVNAVASVRDGENKKPGEFFAGPDELFVQCASGALQILKLQREGKSLMTAREFINGHQKDLAH